MNPAGEEAFRALEGAGLTRERMEKARACLNRAPEEVSRMGEPSRAVCAALNATEKPDCVLPDPAEWRLLLSRFHRTLPGLEDGERGALRFTRAHYAVMSLRGEDTDAMLREETSDDGQKSLVVDMFEAVKSWRTMTKERFVEVLHVLLYSKVIGSKGSLDGIKYAVGNLMGEYYAATNEVRAPSDVAAPLTGGRVAEGLRLWATGVRPVVHGVAGGGPGRCCGQIGRPAAPLACQPPWAGACSLTAHATALTPLPVKVVEAASPFQRYKGVVKGVAMYIKSSGLGGTRKVTPLTEGQIRRTVEGMYVGGFAMLQARAVFALTAIVGVRSTFFQFWRWQDVFLQKVLLLDGEAVQASEENMARKDTTVRSSRS